MRRDEVDGLLEGPAVRRREHEALPPDLGSGASRERADVRLRDVTHVDVARLGRKGAVWEKVVVEDQVGRKSAKVGGGDGEVRGERAVEERRVYWRKNVSARARFESG